MRAAYIEEIGAPDVIKVGELPLPKLERSQILVKVEVVAVDPIDTYIRKGLYKTELSFPFIIGRDMVGTVADVGADVSGFKVGDRVWCNNQGYSGRQGTFAEYISVDQKFLYHLPDGVDAANAVACFHSALTAAVGLTARANLKAGETIFINGGSGNVGVCATQLAKSIGARVIVTAGSDDNGAFCLASGADEVIYYKKEDIVGRLNSLHPDGVDVFWDLTLQPDVQKALNVIAHRGRIMLSSGLKQYTTFKVGDFYTRNCTMYGFTITDLQPDELAPFADIINRELTRNTFRPRIAHTLELSEAAHSHELVETNVNGKVILTIAST